MVESLKKVLIFANPIAGRGRGRAIADEIAARLRRDGFDVHQLHERPDDVDIASLGGASAAIAIGGDGTIRAVAQRLYRAFPDRPPPLLIVPMGTANLLGRHLGIRWSAPTLAEAVSRAIQHGKIISLDAARANGELFLLMAGVGMDARIVHELDRVRRGPIDFTSYVLPAALALGFYQYPALTVSVDGKMIVSDLPAVAFVGNVKEYGTGFPILPYAKSDDGLLDVCVLPCKHPGDAVIQLLRTVTGEHVASEGAVYTKGKSIRVESSAAVPVQLDGDAAGHTPLEINLLPVRLPFIVPADSTRAG